MVDKVGYAKEGYEGFANNNKLQPWEPIHYSSIL